MQAYAGATVANMQGHHVLLNGELKGPTASVNANVGTQVAQCPTPNAQCPMPIAHCPLPNALRPSLPMPNAHCPARNP